MTQEAKKYSEQEVRKRKTDERGKQIEHRGRKKEGRRREEEGSKKEAKSQKSLTRTSASRPYPRLVYPVGLLCAPSRIRRATQTRRPGKRTRNSTPLLPPPNHARRRGQWGFCQAPPQKRFYSAGCKPHLRLRWHSTHTVGDDNPHVFIRNGGKQMNSCSGCETDQACA